MLNRIIEYKLVSALLRFHNPAPFPWDKDHNILWSQGAPLALMVLQLLASATKIKTNIRPNDFKNDDFTSPSKTSKTCSSSGLLSSRITPSNWHVTCAMEVENFTKLNSDMDDAQNINELQKQNCIYG